MTNTQNFAILLYEKIAKIKLIYGATNKKVKYYKINYLYYMNYYLEEREYSNISENLKTYDDDLLKIFSADDCLTEFEERHAVDSTQFRKFGTTQGINYGTHSKRYTELYSKFKELKYKNNDIDEVTTFKISNVWTVSEDEIFIGAATALGCDPIKIARLLPHKTVSQVRYHVRYYMRNKFRALAGAAPTNIVHKFVESRRLGLKEEHFVFEAPTHAEVADLAAINDAIDNIM